MCEMSVYDVVKALGEVTGMHEPQNCDDSTGECCDPTLTCPDSQHPNGRVNLCPDPSGVPFWTAATDLTQAQLDKILGSGNPVLLIYQVAGFNAHSTLIAEKDGSAYKFWDPSYRFNPGKTWQALSFADVQIYKPPNPVAGEMTWKLTAWGGGVKLC